VLGAIGSLGRPRLLRSLLFGLTATDPPVFAWAASAAGRRCRDGELAAGARDADPIALLKE